MAIGAVSGSNTGKVGEAVGVARESGSGAERGLSLPSQCDEPETLGLTAVQVGVDADGRKTACRRVILDDGGAPDVAFLELLLLDHPPAVGGP